MNKYSVTKMIIPVLPIRTSMLLINCIDQLVASNSTQSPKILVINFEATFKIPISRYDWNKGIVPYTAEVPDVYMIKTDVKNLNTTLENLRRKILFDPTAKTIFITNSLQDDVFFRFFSETYMDDMVVIENSSNVQLYLNEYKTFREGKSNTTRSVILRNCKFSEELMECNQSVSIQNNVESIKVGLSYNPPSVILKDNTTEGIEVDILRTIIKKLNITMELYTVDEFVGMKRENFSFTGALGSLQRREVDVIAGGLFPRRDSYLTFKYTRPTSVNRYVYIVPAALDRPYWKRIILTFSSSVWIFLLLTFLTASLTASLINRLTKTQGTYNFGTELLKLYGMCLTAVEVKYAELPTKRMIYVSWYLFLVVFSNYFTAKLLSNFVMKKYDYQVHSKNELPKLSWEICMFTDLAEYVDSVANKKIVICYNCEACALRSASKRDLVSIRSENIMKHDMHRLFVNAEGEPLIYFLDDYFLVTYDVIIFRKNHPVYERFNELLYMMSDSGLYNKIMDKYNPKEILKAKVVWRPLRYHHLSFIFRFLMFAFPIIVFLFLLEVKVKSLNISPFSLFFPTRSSTNKVTSFKGSETASITTNTRWKY